MVGAKERRTPQGNRSAEDKLDQEKDATLRQIASVVRDMFHLSPDFPVGVETSSSDIEGWDSLSHSILMMKIEEEFSLDLPLDRIFDLSNIGELADLIMQVRRASPA